MRKTSRSSWGFYTKKKPNRKAVLCRAGHGEGESSLFVIGYIRRRRAYLLVSRKDNRLTFTIYMKHGLLMIVAASFTITNHEIGAPSLVAYFDETFLRKRYSKRNLSVPFNVVHKIINQYV